MSVNVSQAIPAVTLDAAREYLRIEHRLEDNLLEGLVLSATMNAETRLKRPIIAREGETAEAVCNSVEKVPESIAQWILMTVGFWYQHREQASVDELKPMPFADSLLDAWRLYE